MRLSVVAVSGAACRHDRHAADQQHIANTKLAANRGSRASMAVNDRNEFRG